MAERGERTGDAWMRSYAPARRQLYSDFTVLEGRRVPAAANPARMGLTWPDMALIALFMIGLYTTYTIQLGEKPPLPSAPAGFAGLILLWRRREQITPTALGGFMAVLLLYLVSVFCAPDLSYLPRRTNGLIQLTYSLVVGYALFLTVTQATRRQIARLFLVFALVILIGCLLETYGGLRPISD